MHLPFRNALGVKGDRHLRVSPLFVAGFRSQNPVPLASSFLRSRDGVSGRDKLQAFSSPRPGGAFSSERLRLAGGRGLGSGCSLNIVFTLLPRQGCWVRTSHARKISCLHLDCSVAVFVANPAAADPFSFSTAPNPATDFMAAATRPESAGKFEIEAADDFILASQTVINHASFTGLLTGSSPTVGEVVVETYRVFPVDSDVGRTSGPPTFSKPIRCPPASTRLRM